MSLSGLSAGSRLGGKLVPRHEKALSLTRRIAKYIFWVAIVAALAAPFASCYAAMKGGPERPGDIRRVGVRGVLRLRRAERTLRAAG
jgi:hypothetical protein